MSIATLYKVTHLPTGRCYYGSVWAPGKTPEDRLQEHVSNKGSKYIFRLISEGARLTDFIVKTLAVGPKEYICDVEMQLSRDNLWPHGLNGNAGKNIIRTTEGQQIVSNAVSKAKRGRSKQTSAGIARQAEKLSTMTGENRSELQKTWDARKSEYNKLLGKHPPLLQNGAKMMHKNGVQTFVNPPDLQSYLDDGWIKGRIKKVIMSEETKQKLRKPKQKIQCPYCNKIGGSSQMKRYHFENCKHK